MRYVTTARPLARGVSWSPDGTSVAFSATPGSASEIFVAQATGGVVYQLTVDSNDDHSPAYAPNGTIVFSSGRVTGATKNYDLWRWNARTPSRASRRPRGTSSTRPCRPTGPSSRSR
jgi:Tol biopolymer transport system component